MSLHLKLFGPVNSIKVWTAESVVPEVRSRVFCPQLSDLSCITWVSKWVSGTWTVWFTPPFALWETLLNSDLLFSRAELEMIIHAFVSSRLDYSHSLFTCLSNTSLNCLLWTKVVQNTVAKFLTRSLRRSHVIPILGSLHYILIKSRIQFETLAFAYRALHGQAPTYVKELLMPFNTSMTLRSSDPGRLASELK